MSKRKHSRSDSTPTEPETSSGSTFIPYDGSLSDVVKAALEDFSSPFPVYVTTVDTTTGDSTVSTEYIRPSSWATNFSSNQVYLNNVNDADCLRYTNTYNVQRNGDVLLHLDSGMMVLKRYDFYPRAETADSDGVCLRINGIDTRHVLRDFNPMKYAYRLGRIDGRKEAK